MVSRNPVGPAHETTPERILLPSHPQTQSPILTETIGRNPRAVATSVDGPRQGCGPLSPEYVAYVSLIFEPLMRTNPSLLPVSIIESRRGSRWNI